jgi:hypothetical protein
MAASATSSPDARVLDLFAGTGALGLEALSRGAVHATFVDDGGAARALLRDNIGRCAAQGVTKVFRRDATALGEHRGQPFTLVFLDPPYGKGLGNAPWPRQGRAAGSPRVRPSSGRRRRRRCRRPASSLWMSGAMVAPASACCRHHDRPPPQAFSVSGVSHHCPACGAPLPAMARHPWYICALCRDRITDAEGYPLEFGNTSVSGGFAWRRAGEATFHEALGYFGFLDGRPVRVSAARFGGIVAEPYADPRAASGPILPDEEDDRP